MPAGWSRTRSPVTRTEAPAPAPGRNDAVVLDRSIRIEPHLLPLLRAMHAEGGGRGPIVSPFPSRGSLAETLRADLRAAGITRERLFVTDNTRRRITFHAIAVVCVRTAQKPQAAT